MILGRDAVLDMRLGKPRASGDDPRVVGADGDLGVVNPARAGMIHQRDVSHAGAEGKPRASGDDPP